MGTRCRRQPHHAVRVLRDRWGVAHIYARDAHDLFFAQGVVAAQDRLFQMELWKRAGQGRLSEVVGPDAQALAELGAGMAAKVLEFDPPVVLHPAAGFIATANQKMIPDHFPYPIGFEWEPGYRAARLGAQIGGARDEGRKLSLADNELLQTTSLASDASIGAWETAYHEFSACGGSGTRGGRTGRYPGNGTARRWLYGQRFPLAYSRGAVEAAVAQRKRATVGRAEVNPI